MPAAREYVNLSGKGWWNKFFIPSEYHKYTTDLHLDSKSLGIVLDLKKRGIKNNVRNVEGDYVVVISTPSQIETKTRGTMVMDPPSVFNKDGSPWDPKVGIGNGSDITCKVWVRPYKNPRTQKDELSIRLFSIRVDNHIPFSPKNDFEDNEDIKAAKGLIEE